MTNPFIIVTNTTLLINLINIFLKVECQVFINKYTYINKKLSRAGDLLGKIMPN